VSDFSVPSFILRFPLKHGLEISFSRSTLGSRVLIVFPLTSKECRPVFRSSTCQRRFLPFVSLLAGFCHPRFLHSRSALADRTPALIRVTWLEMSSPTSCLRVRPRISSSADRFLRGLIFVLQFSRFDRSVLSSSLCGPMHSPLVCASMVAS
jgi:hypothetical protein